MQHTDWNIFSGVQNYTSGTGFTPWIATIIIHPPLVYPFFRQIRISRSTLLRWVRIYSGSSNKLESLYPKDRNDSGQVRALDEDTCLALADLRRQMPVAIKADCRSESRRNPGRIHPGYPHCCVFFNYLFPHYPKEHLNVYIQKSQRNGIRRRMRRYFHETLLHTADILLHGSALRGTNGPLKYSTGSPMVVHAASVGKRSENEGIIVVIQLKTALSTLQDRRTLILAKSLLTQCVSTVLKTTTPDRWTPPRRRRVNGQAVEQNGGNRNG